MKVVVTGVGVVSALGIGVDKNLAALRKGESGISSSPALLRTIHKLPVGELLMTNEQLHDALGIPQKEHLSRTALLGILAVKEAMSCVEIDFSKRIGLVSSTSVGGMDLTEHFFEEFMQDNAKGRLRDVKMHDCAASTDAIAKYCGINGYTTTISTACSSAANAVMTGVKLLKHNIVDYVLVGGTDALSAFTLNGFKSLMILDENKCRPFDATRAGLNLGEGAGYLLLQREEDASEYYAKVAGFSNRNDAHHQTASSAEGNGAYLAMSDALKMANLNPEQISYINAHGTGTGNNDASESAAFVRLFGEKVPEFSSTKAFTGHTLAAAGGIEAVFSVLSIKFGCIFPNLHFTTPIPEYGLTPVCTFKEGVEVESVLTNSFGFGGNCSSLIFTRK